MQIYLFSSQQSEQGLHFNFTILLCRKYCLRAKNDNPVAAPSLPRAITLLPMLNVVFIFVAF